MNSIMIRIRFIYYQNLLPTFKLSKFINNLKMKLLCPPPPLEKPIFRQSKSIFGAKINLFIKKFYKN